MGNSRKSPFPDSITASIAGCSPGERVVLGLSGGLDSVVLLHVLRGLAPSIGFELSCLHVNHGISPNACNWAKFCENLCKKLEVPLSIEKVDISPHLSSGIEAAARIARYAAFDRMDADCIVLAQHQDDQAETVLLQLLRGAGPKGLSAMGESTRFNGKLILRPLLSVPRRVLEAFAKERRLEWICDESNEDLRFDRNFLRHRLFPAMKAHFPACRETLARAGRHFSEAARLLDELAEIDASGALVEGGLEISRLRELSEDRAKNLLRHFFSVSHVRMPSSVRLREMMKQFSNARRDACIVIRHDGLEIRGYRGFVHIVKPLPVLSGFVRTWHGETRMRIRELCGDLIFEAGCGGIGLEKLVGPVTVRVRKGGERFRPGGNRPTKSLKNLFQENGIPPWQRGKIPLLYCGERLIWVPGIGIDPEFRAQNGLVPRWEPISPQNCDIAGKA